MAIGKFIRRLSGPLEPWLTRTYRDIFFDVDHFADELARLPGVGRVVEIGCGEGALLSALSRRLPGASLLGVDIAADVGRQFDGDRARVRFERRPAADVAAAEPGTADLVILCDVMHHIDPAHREDVWRAAAAIAKPGGRIVLKEWLRTAAPIYFLGYASDRYITGDRIQYQSRDEWLAAIAAGGAGLRVDSEIALRPWKTTNHAFVMRRQAGA